MQFEFAGVLGVPDGRYLARKEGEGDGAERVLVVEGLGVPPSPGRRRRRPREADPAAEPGRVPIARVTAVRAQQPFERAAGAAAWLARVAGAETDADDLVAEGMALLNRALHAHAAASADPLGCELRAEHALVVRIGHGSGEQVSVGRFAEARHVDVRGGRSRRRRRDEELRPQERLAGILGGRERIDACETLLLRARADLDAGRGREAALQLRVAVEALLVELRGALLDPGHEEDMATLEARKREAGEAANAALRGELDNVRSRQVRELVEICERVLRRRRILKG